ncbi:MAG: FAD-binding oxidoreductase [Dehalococcoidia bacterium]
MPSSNGTQTQVDPTQLSNALAGLSGRVVTANAELSEYAVHGKAPQAAVRPEAEDDAAKALEVASRLGATVVPWGGGTRMHLGNSPRWYDLALDLRGMSQVLEHQAADLTTTVQAGCTLAALQEALGKEGQFLPIDPPLPQRATIGGALAVGTGGPLRAGYGPLRDWVIGMRMALPNGAVVKSGGKVVKNVTGYALDRLFIVSLGTLGVITEVTFKVLPLPRATSTVAACFTSPDAALTALHAIRTEGLAPMCAELANSALLQRVGGPAAAALSNGGPWLLLLRAGGRQSTVGRMVDAFNNRCKDAGALDVQAMADAEQAQVWQSLADAGHREPVPALTMHLTGQPSHGAELVRLAEQAAKAAGAGEPGVQLSAAYGGLSAHIWGDVGAPEGVSNALVELRRQTTAMGGGMVVERMPDTLRSAVEVFGEPGEAFAVMRGLKDEYDAAGVMSPGRFLGGI